MISSPILNDAVSNPIKVARNTQKANETINFIFSASIWFANAELPLFKYWATTCPCLVRAVD